MGSVARAWGVCQRTRENDTTVRRESMLRDTSKQLGCQMQACKCGVWPREGATKRTQGLEKRK